MRKAQIQRQTGETHIQLELNLDGQGRFQGSSDLELAAQGDLHVDQHHTVEDVGICLGLALEQALGDKAGIARYGHVVLPMEEALCTVAVDLSGRPYVVFQVDFPTEKIGQFDSQLVEDFWYAGGGGSRSPPARRAQHQGRALACTQARGIRRWYAGRDEPGPRSTPTPSSS